MAFLKVPALTLRLSQYKRDYIYVWIYENRTKGL